MDKLNVEQYEHLMTKINDIIELIDKCKKEFKDLPGILEAIVVWEKKIMELETRIENLKQLQ